MTPKIKFIILKSRANALLFYFVIFSKKYLTTGRRGAII
jgi:hypothetical protein